MSIAKSNGIAKYTRNNWLIDAVLLMSAIISALTGIHFLQLPVGGFQGGRNPMYRVTILFDRRTWDDLHTWFGILMIVTALVHIVVHWNWFVNMIRRIVSQLFQRKNSLNARSRFNLIVNTLIGIGFLITALTGIYLLFFPAGRNGVADPGFLVARTTWDLIHTWAGILLIIAGIAHFAIHWRWVVKITGKMMKAVWSAPGPIAELESH
jgi:uncharacterized membrane protein